MINYFKSYSSLGDDCFFCVTLYLTGLLLRVGKTPQLYRTLCAW